MTYEPPKAFDAPYLLTMGANNGGWVRYQLLPASFEGHRVNPVYHFVEVNDFDTVKVWEGYFHCVHCKLMGTENTMKEYSCVGDGNEKTRLEKQAEGGVAQLRQGTKHRR